MVNTQDSNMLYLMLLSPGQHILIKQEDSASLLALTSGRSESSPSSLDRAIKALITSSISQEHQRGNSALRYSGRQQATSTTQPAPTKTRTLLSWRKLIKTFADSLLFSTPINPKENGPGTLLSSSGIHEQPID